MTNKIRTVSMLALYAFIVGACQSAALAEDAPQIVKITAKKFTYTPDQITVKKGVPVILQLTTADRQHGISIPSLNLRSDIPPARPPSSSLRPKKRATSAFIAMFIVGMATTIWKGL